MMNPVRLHFKSKILTLFLLLLTNIVYAENCNIKGSWQSLSLHNPQKSVNPAPKVFFKINNNTLITTFEIFSDNINANPKLKPNEYPFMFDVAELFISVENQKGNISDHYPYYEFEISPYGNSFEVLIPGHGKSNINDIHIGAKYQAKIEKLVSPSKNIHFKWTAQIEIPLEKLKWSGKISSLYGNSYVISGAKPNKNYWSLNLPNMPKPNFHQPKFFKSIFNTNTNTDCSY